MDPEMTPRLLTRLPLIVVLTARTVFAHDGLARCDLVARGPGEAAFLAFDRELRSALSSADAAALALLVKFPLRVNFPDGARISLHDPATVQLRFQEVFQPGQGSSSRYGGGTSTGRSAWSSSVGRARKGTSDRRSQARSGGWR